MKYLIVMIIFFNGVSLSQWNPQNLLSLRNNLYDVDFISSTTGWAVGNIITKTTDGGATWQLIASGTPELISIAFADENNGLAVGWGGTILKTTNGGINWVSQESGNSFDNLNGVAYPNKNLGIAVTSSVYGELLRTTNGGLTWNTQLSGTNSLNSVSFSDSNNGLAVGSFGAIIRTTNGGATWVSQSSGTTKRLIDVCLIDSSTGIAVGETVLKTTNGGSSWFPLSIAGLGYCRAVSFYDKNNGVVISSGSIYKTTNGGVTWNLQLAHDSNTNLYSISFTDANNATAVGGGVQLPFVSIHILRTANGGLTWSPQDVEVSNINSVFFSNENDASIVGTKGMIYKTTDGGRRWDFRISGTELDLHKVAFIADKGLSVGKTGIILKTTDGGSTWSHEPSGIISDLHGISFYNENSAIAVGDGGMVISTTNGGSSWIMQSSGTSNKLNSVCFIDSNNGIAVGQNGTIIKTINSGLSWSSLSYGIENDLYSIWLIDENCAFAVGQGGVIIKTTDGGLSWITQASETTVKLNDVFFTDQNIGVVVGENGKILRTTDGGTKWLSQSSWTSNNLNSVFLTDANIGLAVGEGGTILKTINGGLPVELSSFTAKVFGNYIELNWVTKTENNNNGFEIERRFRDEAWITRGFVSGSGTTTEQNSYIFKEELLNDGIYSYRLKQIDYDGSFEYSKEIEVEIEIPKEFKLFQNYPNPFNPTTKIKFSIPSNQNPLQGEAGGGLVTLKVYDVLGNEVATLVNEQKSPGEYEVEFDAGNLSSGIYFYQIKSGSSIQTNKMILIR
jgi:photosystem II stability/assembly factor-like uncharacterized protein